MPAADIPWAVEDIKRRCEPYELFRNYDRGDHRLLFATEKYLNTFGYLFREFADNMCDDVVDGLSDRLQITGWSAGQDQDLAKRMDEAWVRNRGESRFGQVHRNGYREGDGWLMVQENQRGRVRWYPQRPENMAVRYSPDSPDEMEVVAKLWHDKPNKRYRLNLFYPDGHMEKYATKGVGTEGGIPGPKAFQPLTAAELATTDPDADSATAVALDRERIPIWHYPNGTISDYGRSVLANVIPLQDALNKAVSDMLVAMEFLAFPQRWAIGVQAERDPVSGEEVSPFRAGAERIFRVGSKDARLGQFEAASMENFLEVQDSFRLEIARKGGMAPGTIQTRSGAAAAPPSGVALLVMDGKAIKLSRDRQRDWGFNHRDAMAYTMSLELGTDLSAEDIDLDWAPPETRDEKELLETLLLKKELGAPEKRLLVEAGYDTDDVTEWLDEAAVNAEDQAAAERVAAAKGMPVPIGAVRASQTGTPAPPGAGVDVLSA